MKFKYRTAMTAFMVSLFVLSCPLMAAEGGGGGSEEADSNAMTYITIGVAVVIGGLLFLDVITSNDEETDTIEYLVEEPVINTGINWEAAFPRDTSMMNITVSVFAGDNGYADAKEFIGILNLLIGEGISVYSDPVDLGTGSAIQRATMANDFFDADYLIFQVDEPESFQFGIASPDSVLWTSNPESDSNIVLVVKELLQYSAFGDTFPEPY